jgi:hypothetical protein
LHHGTGTAKDFFMVDSKDLRGRTAANIAEAAGLSLVVRGPWLFSWLYNG